MSILSKSIDGGSSYFIKIKAMLISKNVHFIQELQDIISQKYEHTELYITDNVNDAFASFKENQYDLVISEIGKDDFAFAQLCKGIRDGKIGEHPFPIVEFFLNQPDPDFIRRVVDCGPDDILLMPLVPPQFLTRLEYLSQSRMPFVVTLNYTGPTRRKTARPGSEVIPEITVPNPLAAKIKRLGDLSFRRELEHASNRIGALKVQRLGVQLHWLAKMVRDRVLKIGGTDNATLSHVGDLILVAKAISTGISRLQNRSIENNTRSLSAAAKAILAARGEFDVAILGDIVESSERIMTELMRIFPAEAE